MFLSTVLFALAVLVVIGVFVLFNRLVRNRQLVRAAWSDVDVQLKRRYDLITNLVETVRDYMDYEAPLLEGLVNLREKGRAAETVERQGAVEGEIGSALQSVILRVEDYPELKADDAVLELQRTLSEVEDSIQLARRFYNGAVRQLNVSIESFPSSLAAAIFGFKPEAYFELDRPEEGDVVHAGLEEKREGGV